MIRADLPNGTAVSFKYDDYGRRIEKIGAQTLRYIYDNEDIIAILDGSNQPLMILTHGPGIDEPLLMRKPDGSEITLHADGLGSIISHADANGTVIERIEYEAYGAPTFVDVRNITPSTAAVSFTGSPYAYTGREWDSESNLHYLRKRYHDSSSGRFTTEDPIGFAGGDIIFTASLEKTQVNLYAYTENNPMNFFDPLGLSRIEFNRREGIIYIYPGGQNTQGPPQRFSAHNQTVNPSGNPLTPNSRGPIPNGTFSTISFIETGEDANGRFGTGFVGIRLPRGTNGQRTGVGIHAGRRNSRRGYRTPTFGCIRTTEDGVEALRRDNPFQIIIRE